MTKLVIVLLVLLLAMIGVVAQTGVYVEQVEINLMESLPVQVSVTVTGNLADGCTRLIGHTQQMTADEIQINMLASRNTEMMCTQALVPFEEVVPVDIAGLPTGTYQVRVNEVLAATSLTLEEGMIPPPHGTEVCPEAGADQISHVNEAFGYCYVTPDGFDITANDMGTETIFPVDNLLVSLSILVEPADGRSLDDVVAEWLALVPDAGFVEDVLDHKPAVMTESLPGPTGNRQVFVIWQDTLYQFVLSPVDPARRDETAVAQNLWETFSASLTFFHPVEQPFGGMATVTEDLGEIGLQVTYPQDWQLLRQPGLYGLTAPTITPPDSPYVVTIASIFGISDPTSLDVIAAEAVSRYQDQGEADLVVRVGEDRVTLTGFQNTCQITLIPGPLDVRTIEVSQVVCDAEGNITDEVVADVVGSVQPF